MTLIQPGVANSYDLTRLDDLRDIIHARAAEGHPVIVGDPRTEHGRRLLHTLGAQVTVTMTLAEYIDLVERADA